MNFNIKLHDDEYISNSIRNNGYWDRCCTEVLNELFRTKTKVLFVDIGANIGYFTLMAASLKVPVIAFEPIKANFELLQQSVEVNKFEQLVVAVNSALSDKKEQMQFNILSCNMGLCSSREIPGKDKVETVSANTFDSFFTSVQYNNARVIVKIDVEEQEMKVLRGMRKSFEKGLIYIIIIEILDYSKEMWDFFELYGFKYVINIGHDGSKAKEINLNSDYMNTEKYYTTLEYTKNFIHKLKSNGEISQSNLLLTKTRNPLYALR